MLSRLHRLHDEYASCACFRLTSNTVILVVIGPMFPFGVSFAVFRPVAPDNCEDSCNSYREKIENMVFVTVFHIGQLDDWSVPAG